MKLILLTKTSGETVYVNSDHIITVHPTPDHCFVCIAGNNIERNIYVKEEAAQIKAMIDGL